MKQDFSQSRALANVICAFSADHVIRLTGLSKTQLRYWDQTAFFPPYFGAQNRRTPFSRIYSFTDVVGFRTLGILRREFRIPLQTLRKVASELEKYVENPWSDIVLYVRDKDVAFKEPSTGKTRSVLRGQYEANIPLKKVAHDVVAETRKLQQRPKGLVGQVEKHRYIQHNANVIAGTRIPTKAILRYREAGFSTSAILREYPLLERADVEAALAYEDRLAKSA